MISKVKNKTILTLISLFTILNIYAKSDVTFEASAPSAIVIGNRISLVYTANHKVENLRIPELKDFDILTGPMTSTSRSISFINGKRSSNTEYKFTYLLIANKVGTFTINPATAEVDGKKMSSNSLKIKVLPKDDSSQNSIKSNSSTNNSSSNISGSQVFVRAIPSKTTVYEQEPISVVYKLYTRVNISGFENVKFPENKGFLTQEEKIPQTASYDMENYKGHNYRTAILKKNILYPRETGKLKIEPGNFEMTIRISVADQSINSIFDDFFNSYQDVKKVVKSNPIYVNVKPFPKEGKPKDFCGISSSDLKMTSSITSSSVHANDAVTIKLKISGSGNIKLIKTPEFKLPPDFDAYDPKIDNSFKVSSSGMSGSKSIEYLFIPRYAGDYKIPSVSLSYFNPKLHKYVTLKSKEFTLNVEKGKNDSNKNSVVSGNFASKEKLKLLGKDIRYIKSGEIDYLNNKFIYNEWWFKYVYIISFMIFIIFLYSYRKIAKENNDLVKLRNKKANKVANKKLKKAAIYLKENKKDLFYDEVLNALWGYTSDKLNIPLSSLSKDTIEAELKACNVYEDIISKYLSVVQDCEFERYSPSTGVNAMSTIYENTLEIINTMENKIKK